MRVIRNGWLFFYAHFYSANSMVFCGIPAS
nr:MAG TPA: hypothetical protein [Caudoviricetes sp.]